MSTDPYRYQPNQEYRQLPGQRQSRVLDERSLARLLLTASTACLLCIGAVLAWFISLQLPVISSVADYQPPQATVILDRRGEALDVIAHEFRLVLPYQAMPELLPKAFVAAEDGRFWEHAGVDGWSILRAAINNILSRSRSQGGSTITQQVTRALMLGREKTYSRKLTEAFLSYRLEKALSKEDILTIYLNEIYLGEGAYGVEAAALTYFGKPAAALDLAEIALLAGLPQSPSNYSPLKNFQAAKGRQRYVLNRMVEEGIISADEAHQAFTRELSLINRWKRSLNGYFALYIRNQLSKRYTSAEILTGGLRVSTSVDGRLQEVAMRALLQGVDKVAQRQPSRMPPQAALVALDTDSGRIVAMIGGTDFNQNQFNRAVQAMRQPGSAFKPILYAAALDQGIAANSTIADRPLSLELENGRVWKPKNFGDTYRGNINLRNSLVVSSNVAAVRLLKQTGFAPLLATADRLGISAPLQEEYSLALGSSPVSLLELTCAYTAFANDGLLHAPVAITSVRDASGRVHPWPQAPLVQALNPAHAKWLHSSLVEVVQRGTGRQASGIKGASGKTGTTDNNADAWFIGSIPDITAGVWVGHDHSVALGPGEGGGSTAAPIWRAFMQEAQQQ
ncbi:MAG: PBP1A family penicillin-binding protein [Desulfobulbaceae bacterium]|nr:PBP1A family penicillin-binding protein [Desulfobulbaceae bacterium]